MLCLGGSSGWFRRWVPEFRDTAVECGHRIRSISGKIQNGCHAVRGHSTSGAVVSVRGVPEPHGMASSSVSNAVSGSAYASHAALRTRHGIVRVAVEKRGCGRGRLAARRTDDGPFPRGYAVHVRPDNGPGRYTDRGDDALHFRSDQQAVDQVQNRSTHTR